MRNRHKSPCTIGYFTNPRYRSQLKEQIFRILKRKEKKKALPLTVIFQSSSYICSLGFHSIIWLNYFSLSMITHLGFFHLTFPSKDMLLSLLPRGISKEMLPRSSPFIHIQQANKSEAQLLRCLSQYLLPCLCSIRAII